MTSEPHVPPHSNRRASERVVPAITVTGIEERATPITLLNVGRDGAMIYTLNPAAVGDTRSFEFDVIGVAGSLAIQGRIVHVMRVNAAYVIGVEFVGPLTSQQQDAIAILMTPA